MTTLEEVVQRAHVFVTATGGRNILRSEHMLQMRDNAILCNIGHFSCEIDVDWLKSNCRKVQIKPQVRNSMTQTCAPAVHVYCTYVCGHTWDGMVVHVYCTYVCGHAWDGICQCMRMALCEVHGTGVDGEERSVLGRYAKEFHQELCIPHRLIVLPIVLP